MAVEDKQRGRLIERVRERKRHHQQRSKLYRTGFGVLAVLIILAGVALVPLPGPGWLIVAIGLAMLALEFDRAERILERILDCLESAGEQASRAPIWQKALGVLALGLGLAAIVTAVVLWELPYLPG